MNRLRSLDPPPPVVRYEHKHPGDLIHFDIKRLARFNKPGHRLTGVLGKESRGSVTSICMWPSTTTRGSLFLPSLPDQTHHSAMRFFFLARAHFNRFGFSIRGVLNDNGSCYKHWLFRKLLHRQNIRHSFTRPYTPRTNGKAERFIQTCLRVWAYARSYRNSEQRAEQLDQWLHDYNFHRPHSGIKLQTPASRAPLESEQLLTLHS